MRDAARPLPLCPVPPGSAETCCPPPWLQHGGSCYLFSKSQKPWAEADRACQLDSAHLVVVNSLEEQVRPGLPSSVPVRAGSHLVPPFFSSEIYRGPQGPRGHLDGPDGPERAVEMGGRHRLRHGVPVRVPPRVAPRRGPRLPSRPVTLGMWGRRGPDPQSPRCAFSGTGGHSSLTTGTDTGWEGARTAPTSLTTTAAGMMTCARGPTAGCARQSWAKAAESLPAT